MSSNPTDDPSANQASDGAAVVPPIEPAEPINWSNIASRQEPNDMVKELKRLYDEGTLFFTQAGLSEIIHATRAFDGCAGRITTTDLTNTHISYNVGIIGEAGKEAIHDRMFWCSDREAAKSIIENDLAENMMQRSGALLTDLDNVRQPGLRKLYELVVEKLPSNRDGVRRVPQLCYSTFNDLIRRGRTGIFDPKKAFLPITVTWIKNVLPRLDEGNDSKDYRVAILELRNTWEEHDHFGDLEDGLKWRHIPRMRKIVAFACNEMERVGAAYQVRDQLGFMLALKKYLETCSNVWTLPCLLQDPFFTENASWSQQLAHMGVTVVDEPQALLALDRETVVIALNPTIPIRQITADITRPAMMIWHSSERQYSQMPAEYELNTPAPDQLDPNSPRVAQMQKDDYDEITWRGHGMPWKTPLSVFIRKSRS